MTFNNWKEVPSSEVKCLRDMPQIYFIDECEQILRAVQQHRSVIEPRGFAWTTVENAQTGIALLRQKQIELEAWCHSGESRNPRHTTYAGSSPA